MFRYKPIYNFHAVFLIALMLLQSCTIYYKQNYTPEEVVNSQKKIRLTDKNGEKYPFYKLIERDSNYFVLAKESFFFSNKFKHREKVDLGIPGFSAYQINPDDYNLIQIKNTSASAWITAASFIVVAGALLWIFLDSYYDSGIFSL